MAPWDTKGRKFVLGDGGECFPGVEAGVFEGPQVLFQGDLCKDIP